MGKNIVLCFDGTGDFNREWPTHVKRLEQHLINDGKTQVVKYIGGVGTDYGTKKYGFVVDRFLKVFDGATANTLHEKFIEGYEWLVDQYEDGDLIFLFGFSRGAYTARAVAGAMTLLGLLDRDQKDRTGRLWDVYDSLNTANRPLPNIFDTAMQEFGGRGRAVPVEFMGLWDTVSTFGLIDLRSLPFTRDLQVAKEVYHALSLDEARNMFPANHIEEHPKPFPHLHPDIVRQSVWFAGVHRDIGGGDEKSLGLSMISYEWILSKLGSRLHFGPKGSGMTAPNPLGKSSASWFITWVYGFANLTMMLRYDPRTQRKTWFEPGWTHLRTVFSHEKPPAKPELSDYAWVHESVHERNLNLGYKPKNLVEAKFKFLDNPDKAGVIS